MPHRAHAILNGLPAAILRYDRDGRILYANEFVATLLGRSAASLEGVRIADLVPPSEVRDGYDRQVERVFATGQPVEFEMPSARPGITEWFQVRLQPEFDATGGVETVLSIGTDITKLKATEAALRTSERPFRAFFQHTPAVAWIKGPDGRYQFVSETLAARFGGAERWLGHTDAELLPPDVAAAVVAHDRIVADTRRPLEVVEEVPTADGAVVPWLVLKFPIAHDDGTASNGGIALDLSERQRLEQDRQAVELRLAEAQRVESLGVLAGGVAHDFNNLLTGVIGYTSLARMELSAGRTYAVPAHLQRVEEAAGRAADLCRQMLAFTGKGRVLARPVAVADLVREVAPALRLLLPVTASLRLELATDLPPVTADAAQLRQVLLNLVTNAAESLTGRPGAVTVSATPRDVSAGNAHELPPGRYVALAVADTGCGMDEATKAKVFEPFFSTKFTGRGLGLAAVQGIVRGHKGAVTVDSAADRGSTFTLLLPAAGGST